MVSVPSLNPYRKLKMKLGSYKCSKLKPTSPFFESCLSKEELIFLLKTVGVNPVDKVLVNPVMTFVQKSPIRPLYRYIEDVSFVRSIIDKILNLLLPTSWFGHMIMIVAIRN